MLLMVLMPIHWGRESNFFFGTMDDRQWTMDFCEMKEIKKYRVNSE